jgi:hypothetical protein
LGGVSNGETLVAVVVPFGIEEMDPVLGFVVESVTET